MATLASRATRFTRRRGVAMCARDRARPRNGRIAPARGADVYTSAETPNHMEFTRIRAPKRRITRDARDRHVYERRNA
jgi:hypothetical protein